MGRIYITKKKEVMTTPSPRVVCFSRVGIAPFPMFFPVWSTRIVLHGTTAQQAIDLFISLPSSPTTTTTMTRVGEMATLVDDANHSVDQMLSRVDDTMFLSLRLVATHDAITEYDEDIDDIRQMLMANTTLMIQLHQLQQKCYLFEASLAHNDPITNQTTFEHLVGEFHHLVGGLTKNDEFDVETGYGGDSGASSSTLRDTPPPMTPKMSVLNLKLKPMRCNQAKINKKKSRYRLLSIYNINPLLGTPVLAAAPQFDDFHSPEETTDGDGYETTDDYIPGNGGGYKYEYFPVADDFSSNIVYGTQGSEPPKGIRGGSLPEVLFDHLSPDNIPRISHFLSYGNLRKPPPTPLEIQREPEYSFDGVDDVDAESIISTDPVLASTITNFDDFLRGSRMDISGLALEIPAATTLADLFFEKKTVTVASSYKYHLPSVALVAPVVAELAVCASVGGTSVGSTRQLLSSMINEEPKKPPSWVPSSPKAWVPSPVIAMPGQIWPFLKQDMAATPPTVNKKPPSPTDSMAADFVDIINEARRPIKAVTLVSEQRRPIRIPGGLRGSHSRITIGGHHAYIDHGDSLIFRQPQISRVKRGDLSDALSRSLN